MKKGFTLIELLAVILILGIIALIAIPTVNNIISEARIGAFKSSNDNIIKSIEQDCQTSLLKGQNPILSYIFEDGKSSSNINIKGNLPNDGYIFLNKSCEVYNYYLTDNKNVYTNGEDIREDYMLKPLIEPETSLFMTMYPTYYNNILSINFIDNLNIHENAIEIKDPSVSGNNKIKSWLVPNGDNNFDLYIGSLGNIYSNFNTSYLFNEALNLQNINLSNFKTSFSVNMKYLFNNCGSLKEINITGFDTSNTVNMDHTFNGCESLEKIIGDYNLVTSKTEKIFCLFYGCLKLKSLNFSNWDTSNVVDPRSMFMNCYELESLDLSNWDTSKMLSLRNMFKNCYKLKNLVISNFDTSEVTDFAYLFYNCDSLVSLDLKNFDIRNSIEIAHMFEECDLLSTIDISTWEVNSEYYLESIFNNCISLQNLKIKNLESLNIFIDYLPIKDSNNRGAITIVESITNFDDSTLLEKNWNII